MNFIPLGRPDINEQDIDAVVTVLRSGLLVQGKNVQELEEKFTISQKVKYGIAASNGTATLHLALACFGIGPGDEVIVPALSYIATANAVELVGAKPIFVDIDLDSFNINPKLCEAAITSRTKAIIPVHEFGLACDIEKICAIAAKNNLFVIEDAACALGAHQNGKPVGSFGDIGSFSLHPRKSITSGEGGVLVTDNESLTRKARQLRNHGIEISNGTMNFVEAGFNYRMTDFQAALANSQLTRLTKILSIKNNLAATYLSEIKNARITLPFVPPDRNHTWQTFHLLLDDSLDQQLVMESLKQKNIGTNYGAQCIPSQQYYQKKYNFNASEQFPMAYRAYTKGLAIPLYERLSEDQISYIVQVINKV